MSKVVSFRLSDSLVIKALEKLRLNENEYKELTSQLNDTAYSLVLAWLTDDRNKSELSRLTDVIDDLVFKVDGLESKIENLEPKPIGDYEELARERERLEDRVSELLSQIDDLKLEIKNLTQAGRLP